MRVPLFVNLFFHLLLSIQQDVFIIEVLKMGDFKMFLLVFETFLDITVTHIKAINIVVKIPIKYHVLFMHLIL